MLYNLEIENVAVGIMSVDAQDEHHARKMAQELLDNGTAEWTQYMGDGHVKTTTVLVVEKPTDEEKAQAADNLSEYTEIHDWAFDPEVCPSSLDEDGTPMDPSETAHKWDTTTNPITCAECGVGKE